MYEAADSSTVRAGLHVRPRDHDPVLCDHHVAGTGLGRVTGLVSAVVRPVPRGSYPTALVRERPLKAQKKKKILKVVALGVAYFTYLPLLAWWNPTFVTIHNTFTYLVLIAWMLFLFAVNWRLGSKVDRELDTVMEYYEQGIVAWTYAQHCKVRTVPEGTNGVYLQAICGCSESIGLFPVQDPEQLLKLAAAHMVAKSKQAREDIAKHVDASPGDLEARLSPTDAPLIMREEAKSGDTV